MNKDNKNTELNDTGKKLHISDVMNSITLNKFEISLINILKWDINDILVAREQRKEFVKEWSLRYCS
jgi:hypothetical protein